MRLLALFGSIVLVAMAGVVGCGDNPARQDDEGLTCDVANPVGVGSWGPAASLADFSDADLVLKARVSGHRTARREQDYLVNQLVVQKTLRGDVTKGDEIAASSGGGVCLTDGDELYLFLSADDSSDRSTEPIYWIVHPQSLFPITDGRVELYKPIRDESDAWFSSLNGITEQELERMIALSLR